MGWGVWCDALSSDWVRHLALSYSLSYCPVPLSAVCVCCHSIVGLVLCLCDRVVSLWNSGGGFVWVEGCVVFTVYTSSVLWCASQWCVL
nr:MAG TPA: hypothetical protein [Caudoviricetes sp.]